MKSRKGLFNIHEPVIFGYSIVYNISLILPFILVPALGIIISYMATAINFMNFGKGRLRRNLWAN